MAEPIKILFNKCAPFSGNAKFSASIFVEPSPGEAVIVEGTCVEEGWIFCGTCRDPDYPSFPLLHGPLLQVYGGTFEMVAKDDDESIKEEKNRIKFMLRHDGTSPEILVVYGTKQRGHS